MKDRCIFHNSVMFVSYNDVIHYSVMFHNNAVIHNSVMFHNNDGIPRFKNVFFPDSETRFNQN